MTNATGPVVLVTGAGTGIGRAIAHEFGAAGARVVVSARTVADIDRVVEEITSAGGSALGYRADVTEPGQVEAMMRDVRRARGAVEVLVNNAGTPGPAAFAQDVAPQEFLDVLRTNLWGAFLCTKFVLPGMVERRAGRIINLTGGGAASDRPLRGGLAYASSKAGVEGMTRNLALEVGRFGVTVNAISPGRVDTRGFPAGQIGGGGATEMVPPVHAARLAVWLASPEAADLNGETVDAVAWDQERAAK